MMHLHWLMLPILHPGRRYVQVVFLKQEKKLYFLSVFKVFVGECNATLVNFA